MNERYFIAETKTHVSINVPKSEVDGFRAALEACRCFDCRATRSTASEKTVQRVIRGLGKFATRA